jgi:hypothetical protein
MQKGPPKQEGSSRSYLCDHLEDMEQIGVDPAVFWMIDKGESFWVLKF